jgi:hypothetical protein
MSFSQQHGALPYLAPLAGRGREHSERVRGFSPSAPHPNLLPASGEKETSVIAALQAHPHVLKQTKPKRR